MSPPGAILSPNRVISRARNRAIRTSSGVSMNTTRPTCGVNGAAQFSKEPDITKPSSACITAARSIAVA